MTNHVLRNRHSKFPRLPTHRDAQPRTKGRDSHKESNFVCKTTQIDNSGSGGRLGVVLPAAFMAQ